MYRISISYPIVRNTVFIAVKTTVIVNIGGTIFKILFIKLTRLKIKPVKLNEIDSTYFGSNITTIN